MKRLLLNVLLCATLFVGCTDVALDHDSLEEFIQVNNIQPSQIIYYTTNDGFIVHIDDYIGDAKVIANRYENGRGVIVCDRTITSIGNSAFYDCDGLTSVTIPNNVTSIGNSAFYGCDGLTSITIPNGVTKIGNSAFEDCDGLTSATIGNRVTSIGDYAFSDCDGLTSITIPNSVTSIGDSAFYSCRGLTSVTIPNSVTSIGNYAFINCRGLTSITIPNSVTSIGAFAFCDCSGLTSITIPNSVTSIGDEAFEYCDGLKSVYCKAATPPTLGGSSVFDNNGSGRKIYVPTSSVSAYKSASYWSEYASSIVGEGSESGATVPSNYEIWYTSSDGTIVNPYSKSAFDATIISNTYKDGCGVITFDKEISSIGYRAFYDCDGLTSITIPNSVTSIGRSAFSSCSSLTSITIPNSVTSIGDYAFKDCYGLTSITIPNSVTSIGANPFFQCSKLKEFKGKFASTDGRCLIVDGVLNSFAPSGLTTYTIPNSVTSIGNSAFSSCSRLTSITIPNSVTSIGDSAFSSCSSLTSITIPNSVTSIGDYAFRNCYGLTSITIPNSVTSIGNRAFNGCRGLTSVYCKATTPPTLGGSYVFDNNGSGCKIYVPTSSVSAYKSASYWSEYASSIVGYDF